MKPDMNFTKGAGKDAKKIAAQGKADTKIGPNSKPMPIPKGGKGRKR